MEKITQNQMDLIVILKDLGIDSQKIAEIMQFLQEDKMAEKMLRKIIQMYDNKETINQETIMNELAKLINKTK